MKITSENQLVYDVSKWPSQSKKGFTPSMNFWYIFVVFSTQRRRNNLKFLFLFLSFN